MQKILVAIAAVILVVIGFSVGQAANDEVSFRTSSSDADDATANYDFNALTTDNVYQQIVVAGWGTRDMLEVIANQTDGLDRMAVAINETQRVQIQLQTVQIVLLGVLILAIVLLVPRREKRVVAETPSEQPEA
jgi:tRNA A22 N-methylase